MAVNIDFFREALSFLQPSPQIWDPSTKPKGVIQRLSCNRFPSLEFHSIIHPFPDSLGRSLSGSKAQHSTRVPRHTKFAQHRLAHRVPSPRISTAVESKVVHNKPAWKTSTRVDVGKGKKESQGREVAKESVWQGRVSHRP